MLRSFFFAAAVSLVPAASLAQSPFTLEQILSSPFPTSLVAAPNHGKLAWVQNAEGKRNIWVALAKRNVDYEELVFPDEVHGFLLHENWLNAFRAAADFIDRKLEAAPSSTEEQP